VVQDYVSTVGFHGAATLRVLPDEGLRRSSTAGRSTFTTILETGFKAPARTTQALRAGVFKLVGATAHYVTPELGRRPRSSEARR